MNRAISGIMAAMIMAVGAKAATHVEWKNEKVVVHCDKADEWDKNMRIDDALTWNNRPTACWEHASQHPPAEGADGLVDPYPCAVVHAFRREDGLRFHHHAGQR